jgi:valyl-tRNA synthetase
MPRFEARGKVIGKLKSMDLLRGTKDHEMVLPTCSRTGDVIEPLLKEQWFANASKLFKICGEAVNDGRLKLTADFRANLWNHYVNAYTQKDWCISRQLWWGQRIPAYLCSPENMPNAQKWFAGHDMDDVKAKAAGYFKTSSLNIQQGAVRVRFFFGAQTKLITNIFFFSILKESGVFL